MLRRQLVLLCQQGVDPIYGIIGDWGYRDNLYSIQVKAGTLHYKESYPTSTRGVQGVEGPVIKYNGEDLGVPDFKPEYVSTLWRDDGTIYFEKDGDVLKAVFCPRGVPPIQGLKSKALRIDTFENRKRRVDDELKKRVQERIDSDAVSSARYRVVTNAMSISIAIGLLVWVALSIPDDD
eukprot:TRINITY_DN12108_c0_g1_i1.p1 TRINITY_DN12108_c0_g1~~TRINITY_DN12108_c0_g1_i1.p1  ORF type:complete len:179 (+),score=28.27 TRINITY_DN12108_c0_g1_i1:135-671(+)